MPEDQPSALPERIAPTIYVFRDTPVIMDADVALFFGKKTGALNQQVKRNPDRFKGGYAFQLTAKEYAQLKSQTVTSNGSRHGGRRTPPWMYSEHGVVMIAAIVNTPVAIAAARHVVDTFVEQRRRNRVKKPLAQDETTPVGPATQASLELTAKLHKAIANTLDALTTPSTKPVIQKEAQKLFDESIGFITEKLRTPGSQNKKTIAEVHKTMKEAELVEAKTKAMHVETEHRRLLLLTRKLIVAMEMIRMMETESTTDLLAVLHEFDRLQALPSMDESDHG